MLMHYGGTRHKCCPDTLLAALRCLAGRLAPAALHLYVSAPVAPAAAAQDPKKRATADQILQHPWMRENGVASDKPLDNVILKRMG